MGTVTFRVDPTQLDPVWLERDGSRIPALVAFGPEYRFAFQPDPVVLDAAGRVLIRDGLTVDPGDPIGAHPSCPGGSLLSID